MRADGVRDASVTSRFPGLWEPQATVTIRDLTGAAVSGAIVTGAFGVFSYDSSCVTGVGGRCTLGDALVEDSVTSSSFGASSVKKGAVKSDGPHATITLHHPTTPTPTPTPTTQHIGDLDDATSTLSSTPRPSSSLRAAAAMTWQPKWLPRCWIRAARP